MSFLLDTDVLSQPAKPAPNHSVLTWIRQTDPALMFLSVATLLEVRHGIDLMASGKRQNALRSWLDTAIPHPFPGRILAVTPAIALDAGSLIASAAKAGFTVLPMDALIAATARVHGFSVVTLNQKHFARLNVTIVKL